MAIWNSANALVTKEGAKILSQIQAGIGKLTISRIVTGGGYVPPARLYDQTAVSDIRQETKLVNIATDENGSAIEVQVDNSELAESYSLYQLGVYVTHESVEGEVLYWIAQCDENSADVIPLPSELPVALNYSIYVEHSNAGEITILVNPEGSVSLTTFNAFKEEINNKVQGVSDDLSEHKTDVDAHSDYKGATTESAGVRGFVPASPVLESEKDEKFLRSDGTWAEAGKVKTVNGEGPDENGNVEVPTMQGATSTNAGKTGTVPQPPSGAQNKYLRGDGTWQTIPQPVIATQSEAESGIDNTKHMTPLRVKQAIVAQVKGVPIGTIIDYASNTPPDGYLVCNGATISRTTYSALFSVIGTKYGSGDGSSTFALPNLINKFKQGASTAGTNKAAGLPNITGAVPSASSQFAYNTGGEASGAFYIDTSKQVASKEGDRYRTNGFAMDASRSNAIYGKSTTVQPPAVTVLPCIKY